jgi:hypothetical protein
MRMPFAQFAPDRPVALSRIRLTCAEGDRGSLHVKSTCGPTQKLDSKTDEDICFTDNDLIVIKNCREDACELKFSALQLPDGRYAVFRPSRQATQTAYDPSVSEVRSSVTVKLGGFESLVIVNSQWVAGRGQGPGRMVVV